MNTMIYVLRDRYRRRVVKQYARKNKAHFQRLDYANLKTLELYGCN